MRLRAAARATPLPHPAALARGRPITLPAVDSRLGLSRTHTARRCVFNNQPWAAALLLTYGADPFNSGACDDASAMGKPEVQQVFDAWKNELQHPLLAKAEAKIGVVDGEDDGEEGEEGEEGDEEEEEVEEEEEE